jgi:chromosome segregation ATPase
MMSEEPKITMTEFKTVVESFESKLKTVVEGITDIRFQMKAGFQAVNEQFTSVNGQITFMKGQFTSVKEQVTSVKEQVTSVKEQVTSVKEQVTSVKEQVTSVKEQVTSVKEQITSVKEQIAILHVGQTEIKHMLARKPDREEFDKLETRVARLESKVA